MSSPGIKSTSSLGEKVKSDESTNSASDQDLNTKPKEKLAGSPLISNATIFEKIAYTWVDKVIKKARTRNLSFCDLGGV